jgi:hypothetical protein
MGKRWLASWAPIRKAQRSNDATRPRPDLAPQACPRTQDSEAFLTPGRPISIRPVGSSHPRPAGKFRG